MDNSFITPLTFSIDLDIPKYVTSEPFLSFNIDTASLYQYNEYGRLNFSDPDFRELGRQFCTASAGGAVVRIGGSAADDLVFVDGSSSTDYTQRIRVETEYWDSIVDYAEFTGQLTLTIILGVPAHRDSP